MIAPGMFENLVNELLALESKLEALGQVTIETNEGPYALREKLLSERSCPQQKEYNDLDRLVTDKRRIVDAHDMVARYATAYTMTNKA